MDTGKKIKLSHMVKVHLFEPILNLPALISKLKPDYAKEEKPLRASHKLIEKKRRKPTIEYVSCISGWRVSLVEHIIKKAKKKYKDQQVNNPKRFWVHEEEGVRLGLIFSGIQILHKMDKCERIISNIQEMSREEAFYWYSKIRDKEMYRKGAIAMRLLLE